MWPGVNGDAGIPVGDMRLSLRHPSHLQVQSYKTKTLLPLHRLHLLNEEDHRGGALRPEWEKITAALYA